MGLTKSKTTKSGYTAEYHRIGQLNMNYDRLDAVMTVLTYKDQASRDAGDEPTGSFQYDFGSNYHDENYSNGEDSMKNVSLKEAYKVLRSLSQAEEAKTEDKNEDLAYFADATAV